MKSGDIEDQGAVEELHASWARLGIDPTQLKARADGTIRPEGGTQRSDPRLVETMASDEILGPDQPSQAAHFGTEEVLLGPMLGEGGMGKVWLGAQRSLGREVAVKGLRDDLDGPIGRAQLLREARVTGALEHPNIIPVHAIVKGPEGQPLLVMKRVEGTGWRERIDETRGQPDHIEIHLRILMQVCHAVHFAHTRGVLHRDLKPDNIMLGEFGEVYVLDWGIAVALRDDTGIEGLPLFHEVRGIVGTIQYMAPEMVEGHGGGLCPQSDVYLLGAILHEVLTGQPRHPGDAVPIVLHSAWRSEPCEYGGEVPEELAQIANRATHRDPARRPRSADAFRLLVEDFLGHKSSADLAEEAERRLTAGRLLVTRDLDPTLALREARFGFLQSLRIWPQNAAARAGLQDVLSVLMERALGEGHLDTARELLGEMDAEGSERWGEEVTALAREVASRDAKMEHLEREAREADLSQSARPRRVFGLGFALAFLLVNLALDLWDRFYGMTWVIYLVATAATAFAFFVPIVVFYQRLFPNRAARRLSMSLGLMLVGQAATFTASMLLGLELRPALALSLLPFASVGAVKSALTDPRMWWSPALTTACALLGLLVPDLAYYGVGIAYAAFFIGGAMLDYEVDRRP